MRGRHVPRLRRVRCCMVPFSLRPGFGHPTSLETNRIKCFHGSAVARASKISAISENLLVELSHVGLTNHTPGSGVTLVEAAL